MTKLDDMTSVELSDWIDSRKSPEIERMRAAVAPFLRFYDDIRFNLRKQPRPTDAAIEERGERMACVTWEEFAALRKAFADGPSKQG